MLKKINALGNIEVDKKQGYALLSLNPGLYPISTVLSAAERFMRSSCIILDGNPKEEILVEIRAKGKGSIEELAFKFNEELIKGLKKSKGKR